MVHLTQPINLANDLFPDSNKRCNINFHMERINMNTEYRSHDQIVYTNSCSLFNCLSLKILVAIHAGAGKENGLLDFCSEFQDSLFQSYCM